jgi:hypothetical protein
MSNISEQEKYYIKYLKYKNKYIDLNEQINGGGVGALGKKFANVASTVGKKAVAAAKSSGLAELKNTAKQSLADVSASAVEAAKQLAASTAASAQNAVNNAAASAQNAVNNVNNPNSVMRGSTNPDDVWRSLTLEQKQRLIALL